MIKMILEDLIHRIQEDLIYNQRGILSKPKFSQIAGFYIPGEFIREQNNGRTRIAMTHISQITPHSFCLQAYLRENPSTERLHQLTVRIRRMEGVTDQMVLEYLKPLYKHVAISGKEKTSVCLYVNDDFEVESARIEEQLL